MPAGGNKPKCAEVVYFVEGRTTGLIKIGIARDAFRRLATLQTGSPDRLRLLGVIREEDPGALESRLHSQFRKHWSHGEWFLPAMEIWRYIERRAVDAERERDWYYQAAAMNFMYRLDPEGFGRPRKAEKRAERRPRTPKPRPATPYSGLLVGRTIKERLRAYKEARGIA